MATKKPAQARDQEAFDKLFKMMEDAIRLNEYGTDDLFFMIADLGPVNPTLAAAISNHAGDFIKEGDGEATWTDIVVEAYRRALFDVEKAQLYGTAYFTDNLAAATSFVTGYIAGQTLGDDEAPTDTAKRTVN